MGGEKPPEILNRQRTGAGLVGRRKWIVGDEELQVTAWSDL